MDDTYGITTVTTIVPYGMWHPSWILSRDGETLKIVEWLVCGYHGGWDNHKMFAVELDRFMLKFSRGEACELNMALLCQAHPECENEPFRCLGKPYCQRDRFTFDPDANRLVLILSNARESGKISVSVTRRIRHDMLLFCAQLGNAVPRSYRGGDSLPRWQERAKHGSQNWVSSDPIGDLAKVEDDRRSGTLPVFTR